MNRVLIIQARLGSSRLPGKVLEPIGDAPMLARVVDRAGMAASVDRVVVATTISPRDDAIVALAGDRRWDVARGSEDDVLDRYYQTARDREATHVVRVTSDCPLIDPAVIDTVVAALGDDAADYASNTLEPRTFPRGLDVEAMTMPALETAWREATEAPHREHVTPFLYRNPDRFRLVRIATDPGHADQRWSVDTPEDLELVRRLWAEMDDPAHGWERALAVALAHPEWANLNRHVEQVIVP